MESQSLLFGATFDAERGTLYKGHTHYKVWYAVHVFMYFIVIADVF